MYLGSNVTLTIKTRLLAFRDSEKTINAFRFYPALTYTPGKYYRKMTWSSDTQPSLQLMRTQVW